MRTYLPGRLKKKHPLWVSFGKYLHHKFSYIRNLFYNLKLTLKHEYITIINLLKFLTTVWFVFVWGHTFCFGLFVKTKKPTNLSKVMLKMEDYIIYHGEKFWPIPLVFQWHDLSIECKKEPVQTLHKTEKQYKLFSFTRLGQAIKHYARVLHKIMSKN